MASSAAVQISDSIRYLVQISDVLHQLSHSKILNNNTDLVNALYGISNTVEYLKTVKKHLLKQQFTRDQ